MIVPRQRVGLRQMDEQPEARPHHTAVKGKRDEVARLARFPPATSRTWAAHGGELKQPDKQKLASSRSGEGLSASLRGFRWNRSALYWIAYDVSNRL